MCLFSTSGVLLVPKTLQNGKVSPKVKKALLGVLGSKNVPRCLCFSLFGAWGEKHDFSFFAHFCDFSLFGRKSCFWRPKVGKPPKTLKSRPFPPFCENGIQNTLKSIGYSNISGPYPFFAFWSEKGGKVRFGAQKCTKTSIFALFGPKSQKSPFWAKI